MRLNKEQLYKNIMNSVKQTISNTLNESFFDNETEIEDNDHINNTLNSALTQEHEEEFAKIIPPIFHISGYTNIQFEKVYISSQNTKIMLAYGTKDVKMAITYIYDIMTKTLYIENYESNKSVTLICNLLNFVNLLTNNKHFIIKKLIFNVNTNLTLMFNNPTNAVIDLNVDILPEIENINNDIDIHLESSLFFKHTNMLPDFLLACATIKNNSGRITLYGKDIIDPRVVSKSLERVIKDVNSARPKNNIGAITNGDKALTRAVFYMVHYNEFLPGEIEWKMFDEDVLETYHSKSAQCLLACKKLGVNYMRLKEFFYYIYNAYINNKGSNFLTFNGQRL